MKKYASLDETIKSLFGSGTSIVKSRHVSGGDINEAQTLTLSDGTVLFMKSNRIEALPGFESESEGLAYIRASGAIGVPEVLGLGTDLPSGFSFLLLQYIDGIHRIKDYWAVFAADLSSMHRTAVNPDIGYGFPHDNWIGTRKQVNTPHKTWVSFFRDCRLEPQFESAGGYLSAGDRKKADYLLSHLDQYLTEPEKPSLLHGDLWSGNMITGNDGKGWLIDPAVYYGHPEVDIAMTELFGGFPDQFYSVYKETGLLQLGYEDRRDLYNLYQLLNHLNMFGAGYLASVRSILNRYAGI